ncbi:LEM domain-containing protein 1 isoform X2 [Rhineura floridana]|uniref:LEM domain-containing protein 1 isoform X2 n=1 Tax=Rhineura floridana TaxID=261503 RepID=UPI002AC89338|nr:LEM domain-containing protein 1 isoform X2 [Rhineura floridana]
MTRIASTRTIYENKLQQLMKQCPAMAAGMTNRLDDTENYEEGKTTEVVFQTNSLKVTAECASGSDNKSPIDVAERQKKLLSPDVEHSLAKIVAELQEILPEGKVALHRSQGLRKKAGNSSERNCRQKTIDVPHQDFGCPDVNFTVGHRRRVAIKENPPSVKKEPERAQVICEKPREGLIPIRVKIAVFAIFVFLVFVYVTMETNFENPFTSFTKGK